MKNPNKPCLFCTPRDVTRQNEYAYSTRDTYPVSPGHSLIIPFRHCADFFDLDPDERVACLDLLISERDAIGEEFEPDGYNIGINVGAAAGQSVLHVHMHLIPRYRGDDPHPQGGVRKILPDKADYPRMTASSKASKPD
ncbi:MAG: HIT family protein [Gammaproteobacteria bacterium]